MTHERDPGCSVANAAIELTDDAHRAKQVIAGFRREQRDRLTKLCRDAGITAADTLSLMLESARVSR